jgi:hypothetical protein
MAASIRMVFGGGLNGHAEMLLSDANHATIVPGTPFVPPVNPGVYPIGVTAANRARMEAEHKKQIKVFETFAGVGMGLKDLILKAIDENCLLEIEHERLGFLNTATHMLTHLCNCWGVVDFVDITALMAKCDAPWNMAEVPTIYFS